MPTVTLRLTTTPAQTKETTALMVESLAPYKLQSKADGEFAFVMKVPTGTTERPHSYVFFRDDSITYTVNAETVDRNYAFIGRLMMGESFTVAG